MHNFTPWISLLGGVLLGSGALLLLIGCGRIAGISGILGGVLSPPETNKGAEMIWRLLFLAGLILGAWAATLFGFSLPDLPKYQMGWLIVAGLLVGFGTRLGSGCTSGHGICGIGRLSLRSIVATSVFMSTALATVFVVRHLIGEGA